MLFAVRVLTASVEVFTGGDGPGPPLPAGANKEAVALEFVISGK
jgi:hypothetical protein